MPVHFVLVQRGNPAKPNEPKKWYAQHTSAGEVTLRQLIKQISARSTVSGADVAAVLESLLELLPELLGQGQIVRLGDFGSFSATLNSEGVADEKKFDAATHIRSYNVRFRPGRELVKALRTVDYEKTAAKSPKGA